MKLVGKRFERDGTGTHARFSWLTEHSHVCQPTGEVALIAEEPEDLWHVYNLVVIGDHVRSGTWRHVPSFSVSSRSVSLNQPTAGKCNRRAAQAAWRAAVCTRC